MKALLLLPIFALTLGVGRVWVALLAYLASLPPPAAPDTPRAARIVALHRAPVAPLAHDGRRRARH